MELGILSLTKQQKSSDLDIFTGAARKKGIILHIYQPHDLIVQIKNRQIGILGKNLKPVRASCFINRVPDASVEQINLACSLLQIPFLNNVDAVRLTRDKTLTRLLLCHAGIPQPKTLCFYKSPPWAYSNLPQTPYVFKPETGSYARYAKLFSTEKGLASFLKKLEINRELYFENFIPDDVRNIKVIVIGEKVLGAIKNSAAPGRWRTHPQQGGSYEPYRIDRQLATLCLRTAAALKLKVAGLDIGEKENGDYLVLGASAVPEVRRFEETSGISITGAIIDFMVELVSSDS